MLTNATRLVFPFWNKVCLEKKKKAGEKKRRSSGVIPVQTPYQFVAVLHQWAVSRPQQQSQKKKRQ